MNSQSLPQKIQQQAAQCVKCGLCLPHCPTYRLTKNEGESPRGRIALMDNVAQKTLPITAKLQTYLDHCLTCQACEAVCPANVPYGELIDNARALLNSTPGVRQTLKLPRWLQLGIKHPAFFNLTRHLLRFYQKTGLQALFRKTHLLRLLKLQEADALLPMLTPAITLKTYYPAQNTEQGQVALFIGCINKQVDPETLQATIKVLTWCGYAVHVPSAQRCCGALYQHAGYPESANKLQQINGNAFSPVANKISAIITVASGCAAVLEKNNLTTKVYDISAFLNAITWPENLQIKPLDKRVALHTPCTLRNVQQQANAPIQLLQKIPGLTINLLSQNNCCGAAGLYMLKFPSFSADLLQPLLTELLSQPVDYLATSNLGCGLHFQQALQKQGIKIALSHPVTLLAQQLALINQ